MLPAPEVDDSPDAVFVREYMRTNDAKLACVRSGLVDSRYPLGVTAERVLRRPEIQAAIAAVRALGLGKRERTEYSRELILDELQVIHDRSVETGQMTAAISALKEQSSLLGYREQTLNVNVNVKPSEMSLAELEAAVSKLTAIEGEYSIVGSENDNE